MGTPVRPYTRPVTGRVFRRSLDPDLPVAVEARDSTIRDAAGREYLDAAGGAIVVNVGHGRASIARVLGEQTARLAYAHGSAFTTEPVEAYAAEIGPRLPVDDPAIYPVSGGSEAIETALKLSRAYHLARGEAGPLDRHLALGQLPRQHARRARPVGPRGRSAGRTRTGSAGSGTCRRRTRTATASPAPTRSRPGRSSRPSSSGRSRRPGPGTVAAFVAEPIVGATLAAAVPPDDYWPLDRGGLPPPRRAAHRRRGDDGVRADRALVRARPLGRPRRHPRRGQGRDLRLLAVRVRRGVRRDPRRGHGRRRVRPRLHVLPRAGRRGRRPRGAPDPRRGGPRRGEPGQGRAPRGPAPRAARAASPPRRDPRPGPDGRPRARRRPRDAARRSRGRSA